MSLAEADIATVIKKFNCNSHDKATWHSYNLQARLVRAV